MPGITRVTLNMPAITQLIAGTSGPIRPQMTALTQRVAVVARGRIRSNTGRLVGSIQNEVTASALLLVGRVYSLLPYAIIVHEGRGPITAKPGKVLVFVPRGSSTPVFTKRVGPAAPNPFLYQALLDVVPNWTITRRRGTGSYT